MAPAPYFTLQGAAAHSMGTSVLLSDPNMGGVWQNITKPHLKVLPHKCTDTFLYYIFSIDYMLNLKYFIKQNVLERFTIINILTGREWSE